jgi:hypothetical protein
VPADSLAGLVAAAQIGEGPGQADGEAATAAADATAPTERERKPVRIRKPAIPTADIPVTQRPPSGRMEGRMDGRSDGGRGFGPRGDGDDRSRGTGRPAPGRPLPPKR